MRVLHVMASAARGGGAEHLAGLLPHLSRLGIECAAAVGADGPLRERLRGAGIEAATIDLMRSRVDPAAAARLRRAVRSAPPDLVHYHGTRAAFFGAAARLLPGMPPAIYTVHGLSYRKEMPRWRRPIFVAVEALACRGLAGLVSVSAADLEDLIRRGFAPAERALHLPNAVDSKRFSAGGRPEARRRLGLPEDAFIVGTASRLVPQKSVGDLIAAVAACPEALLVVAGDGPERPVLERRARPLGDRVRLLGERDDVPEILRALDVFALASRWEGEAIALLEAMATSLPCVATATTGAREVLETTGAGLLVEIGSPAALAAALRSLREQPGVRLSMGLAGREAVRERTWGAAAARLAAFYGRCATRCPPPP